MRFLIAVLIFSSTACAKDEAKKVETIIGHNCSESVFRFWQGPQSTWDFTGLKLKTRQTIIKQMGQGRSCTLEIEFSPSVCDGLLDVHTSEWNNDGASDPNCTDMATTYTYQVENNELNLCKSIGSNLFCEKLR